MNKKGFVLMIIVLISCVSLSMQAWGKTDYTIKEMTPEIEQALENRRERYDSVRSLKNRGLIGENNRGYLETLSNIQEGQAVVEDENQDRRTIYLAIARQNALEGSLNIIENTFAEVKRDQAQEGDWIQAPDGQWIKK